MGWVTFSQTHLVTQDPFDSLIYLLDFISSKGINDIVCSTYISATIARCHSNLHTGTPTYYLETILRS
jgi:hypothetical protein